MKPAELCGGFHRDGIALGDGASLIAEQTMGLFPYPSPDRSWSWIKDDFRTVPRVYLGLPEGTIGDFSGTLGWSVYDNAVYQPQRKIGALPDRKYSDCIRSGV